MASLAAATKNDRLAEIYSSRDDYLDQVEQSIAGSLEQGFLRPADAEKIRQASRRMSRTIPE